MQSYQADYVASSYNLSKHMGFYYELGFRDLYPGAPECDCQHTTKSLDQGENYHEEFDFQFTGPSRKQLRVTNLITLNNTGHGPAVYKQVRYRATAELLLFTLEVSSNATAR